MADAQTLLDQENKRHFLKNIRQMSGNSVLLRRHDDGRLECVYASGSFAQMMECGQEEARRMMDGVGFFLSTRPEDRPLVRDMVERRAGADGGADLTIQKTTAQGHTIWCNVHYAFIDDFGERYVYCTYSNVTVLKAYEERLRGVYLSLGDSFYQTGDKTLALIRANLTRDEVEDARGPDPYATDDPRFPYSQLLQSRAKHYPIRDERLRFLDVFSQEKLTAAYLSGRVQVSQVLFSQREDGRSCFVDFSATLTRHPITGDVVAFITERECNSEKVRETLMGRILAQQFDMVAYLTNGRYGVTIGDASRIKKGNIFPASRSGEYRQYLESQVLPALTGTDEYRAAMAHALALDTVLEQVRQRDPYVVNIACAIDGVTYYKRFDFYAVDPEAKFCILLKSDTTEAQREQIQRNDQLREALAEATRANAAKTTFLSSMSHEIRTPMNAIIGLDNIALRDPDLPPRAREQLEKIAVSAHHLLRLINDILDMSRIESGRMALREEEFSFPGFVEQINTLVQSQCDDRGLSYTCTVDPDLGEFYIGDDMKLKQVLINILGNAVKFTPAPGQVSLDIRRVARFDGRSTLRFTAKDTGIGMDAAYLPKVFDAFSQEDAATTSSYGGSGLGMAITKNIVEMMNGDIAVSSRKGEGSAFTVTVTLRDSARKEAAPAPQRPEAPAGQDGDALVGRRVLLAEDIVINAEILTELLETRGVTVEWAGNGQLAVERFTQSPPGAFDAILMDVRMPVMDGLQATEAIRALDRPDSRSVPIIAMTANAFDEDVQRSLQAGMNAHLTKPVEPQRLYETLAGFLGKREAGG